MALAALLGAILGTVLDVGIITADMAALKSGRPVRCLP